MDSSGVAVCIVDPGKRCVLVGRERFGKYASRYNICSGSVDPDDNKCLVAAAMREVKEELKLRFDSTEQFLAAFSNPRTGRCRYLVLGSTPILIGWFGADSLCLDTIRGYMKKDIENTNTPPCYKEMDDVRWQEIDRACETRDLSRLAIATMKRLRLPTNGPHGPSYRECGS